MKSFFILTLFIVHAVACYGQLPEHELPKTWTKDYVVTLTYSGSMDGSSTRIDITYDSCKYFKQSGMNKPARGTYAMTEADRTEILKKFHELKVDKIKSEMSPAPVNDGHSSILCFGTHCVEAGTSAKISTQDKEQFTLAYVYIEDFAATHAKLKMEVKGLFKKKRH